MTNQAGTVEELEGASELIDEIAGILAADDLFNSDKVRALQELVFG